MTGEAGALSRTEPERRGRWGPTQGETAPTLLDDPLTLTRSRAVAQTRHLLRRVLLRRVLRGSGELPWLRGLA